MITYRSVHHPDVPEVRDNVRASMLTSGIQLTPYITHGESGPMAFTLFLWIAQLDREGILIYTPDLLNETDELFRSFHNLRTVLFEDFEKKEDQKTKKAEGKTKSPDNQTQPGATSVRPLNIVKAESEAKISSPRVSNKPMISDSKPSVLSPKPSVFPAATKLPPKPTEKSHIEPEKSDSKQTSVSSRAVNGGGKSEKHVQ
jgi:hypothetical protein